MLRNALLVMATLAVMVALGLAVWWAWDVESDRRHVVFVNGPTPVFIGSSIEGCPQIPRQEMEPAGATLHVRRIRFWKDCATIDVTTPNGAKGYVVFGIGNFRVDPKLETD
jgi:hypothetical protein